MKFDLELDLTPARTAAKREIDLVASMRARRMTINAPLYEAKLRGAEETLRGYTNESIVEEARLRSISPNDLAKLVIEKNAEAALDLSRLELLRQQARFAIDAAADDLSIRAIVEAFKIPADSPQ